MIKIFLNPEGHQNAISGSKVRVILLKGWILPIGGVALERLQAQPTGLLVTGWHQDHGFAMEKI